MGLVLLVVARLLLVPAIGLLRLLGIVSTLSWRWTYKTNVRFRMLPTAADASETDLGVGSTVGVGRRRSSPELT